MNPLFKKWVAWPLLIIVFTLAVLAGIAFIILATQENRIVNMAVDRLNQRFQGELVIEESEISLFQNFPYVSIVLQNGSFFADKQKTSRPIARFDRLYVGFDLNDIIQERYDVKMLSVQGGYMDIVQETNGKINLLEAERAQKDTAQVTAVSDTSSVMALDLEKIKLEEMRISFLEKSNGQKYTTRVNEVIAALKMDSTQLIVALTGKMKLDFTSPADSTLFRDKRLTVTLDGEYKWATDVFDIMKCNFKLEDAGFAVSGSGDFADTTKVNFRVKGERQDFNLFTAFLPEGVKGNLKPFQYDGRLYFDAIIRGKITENQLPLMEVAFGCEDAWFLNTGSNRKVDQLNFKGYYTNGHEHSLKTSEVHILSVSARPEKGVFRGNFVVRDFTDPKTLVQINSELELKFLGEFLGIADLKQISGKIKLDMNFRELHDVKLPEESLNKLKEGIESKLTVENLTFRIPGYPHAVKNMNVHAEMRNGRVVLDSASLRIGKSDLRVNGSVSDIRAFLHGHDHHKTVKVVMNAGSDQIALSDLLSYDTALSRKWNEEIRGFHVNLALETTVRQLLNPSPLPKGTFEMKHLQGTFKNYPHTIKDLGATVLINDTLLRLRDFTGMIDSSDINFKGRVINYQLWFADVKKGKTEIAFDFKSNRFAFKDVLGREIRQHLPRGYRREELNNVWLRAKVDMRYDTVFRFAKAKVVNVSADLKRHNLKLHNISGGVKYGSKILSFDTLRGKIGNSDFDIGLKYYFKGIDRYNNKVSNSLTFTSKLLDVDEMSHYDLAPRTGRSRRDTTAAQIAKAKADSVQHAQAFNIFSIPFSDFNAQIDIGKIKYNKLWLKNVSAKLSMRADQTITVDTLMMHVARGSVRMRGKFNGSNHEKIYFRSRIAFDSVDIEKMLLKLDHFGQDVAVNKHVKGRLSGQIKSYVRVHPDLVPIIENSKAEMTLKIYNGSLIDFAPMQAMSSYFKDKNLRLIRFDTLINKFTYADGVLDIPAMHINSSLGYIQLSGKQSIDYTMEYYVRVPLKMVTKVGFQSLFSRKQEEVDLLQVDEIEYMDKDKKIAFMNLKISGTPDDFKVGLGKDKGRKL